MFNFTYSSDTRELVAFGPHARFGVFSNDFTLLSNNPLGANDLIDIDLEPPLSILLFTVCLEFRLLLNL